MSGEKALTETESRLMDIIKLLESRTKQKDKEVGSLKDLEDHLNKRDKINRDKIEQLQKDNKAQQEVVDKLVEVLRGCAYEYDNEWGDGSEGSGSEELRDLIDSIGKDDE